MKALINASFKERFELYAEIHPSILVNICQIEIARKGIILLSDTAVRIFKPGTRTGGEERQIKFTLLTCTYSNDDSNAKINVAVLHQRQD